MGQAAVVLGEDDRGSSVSEAARPPVELYIVRDLGPKPQVLPAEDVYVFSDLHLGEGAKIEERLRPSLLSRLRGTALKSPVTRRYDNPLEDFFKDLEFAKLLGKILRERVPGRRITLRFNGDVFDPLAVRWKDQRIDRNPPKERCVAWKFERIVEGHGIFFDALAEFLKAPDVSMVFTAGNHDLGLILRKVKDVLVDRVAGNDGTLRAKIRFVDHEVDFEDRHRGVMYRHGNHAEPQHSVDSKNAILTVSATGAPLDEPTLNDPVGNIVIVRLMNRIKLTNEKIGRIPEESDIWSHEAQFGWGWSARAGLLLAWTILSNMFSSFGDVRQKAGPITMLRIAYSTWKRRKDNDPVVVYGRKLLADAKGSVRGVVLGHNHTPCLLRDSNGTIANSGSWSKRLELVESDIVYRWSRAQWLERIYRRLQHLDPKQKMTRVLRSIAIVLATITFIWTSFKVNGWHPYSYDLSDFVTPAWILFLFWVAATIFRLVNIEPMMVDITDQSLTFIRVRHERGDVEEKDLRIDLMVYDPKDDDYREKV